MAFPTITSVTVSVEASNVTDHTVDYPATTTSGDLIINIFSNDGSGSDLPTYPSGDWADNVMQAANHGGGGYGVSYIIADGTEGGNSITITTPSGEQSTAFMIRILAANWHGTTPPEDVIGSGSTTTSPDCGSLAPSWGSDDTLWICWSARDLGNATVSTYPLPTDQDAPEGGGGGNQIAMCSDELAQASLDPDTWVWSASASAIAGMLAVRPVAAAPAAGPNLLTLLGVG